MDRDSLSRRSARWFLAGASLSLVFAAAATASDLSRAGFDAAEPKSYLFHADSSELDAHMIARLTVASGDLMPGDSVTHAVTAENPGAAPIRYSMTTSSSDPDGKGLRDVLTLTTTTIDATLPAGSCDRFDARTVLGSTTLGSSSAGFGSAAFGADPGDRILSAGTSETLCLRVTMPLEAGNAYQGASTTTTFTFDAESAEE